jgi:hypothetical protein
MKPDFPFYAGLPVHLNGRHWLMLMAALVLAFGVLALLPLQGFPQSLIPALLFVILPLLALRRVAGPHWTVLFGPVGLWQLGQMVAFAALTLVGSLAMGLILSQFVTFSHNPVAVSLGSMTAPELVARLIPTLPQLVGEELLGILPFLAVLWVSVTRMHLSRRVGIMLALVISSLFFGAAHLPTYDWNWAQALIGIGTARVLLTLAYIVTRNLWVSAGAHVLNDWTGFLFAFAVGHAPIGTTA